MLIVDDQYAYINNQGYILEISEIALEVPTITGYVTEVIEPGERLVEEDLKKLNTVIQIVKAAEEKDLAEKITNIDIENEKDYLITMESENKIIHFGDSSNINDKFMFIDEIIKDEEGEKGEIYVKNLNKVYFSVDYS